MKEKVREFAQVMRWISLRVHEVEDPNEPMSLAVVAPCNAGFSEFL